MIDRETRASIDHSAMSIFESGPSTAKAKAWGGTVALCTRDGRFELAEHKDCATRGLSSAGFAVIDLAGKPSTTVRFKEP